MLFGFVAMEPVTYAVHRWVMHGPGMRLHRSHHVPHDGALEANDAFPVVFAAIVGVLMAIGFNVEGAEALVWLGVGVTLYGAAYGLVHDGYIHRRLPFVGRRTRRGFEPLAVAHTLHHRFGGEPYGMLLPVVPRSVRERAARRADSADRALTDLG